MFVGDKLRSLRNAKGHSLFVMARITGLDPQTIRRAEVTGQLTPRTAERLAPVLGCSVKELKPTDFRGQSKKGHAAEPLRPVTGRG